jgi:hypothetical protein
MITLYLHRVEYTEFKPGQEIPLPAYMKRLLQYMLTEKMAEIYVPERVAEFYTKARKEQLEIETDHASRQYTDIKQFDVSYYPDH